MTAIQEITHALAAHLDSWPFVFTQIGTSCVTINYDLYQGLDASKAETAEERLEFDTRIVVIAKVKIQANNLIRLECFRFTVEEERVGRHIGSLVCDMSHPDSLKNILAYLYQHLRSQGYSEQCPEFP